MRLEKNGELYGDFDSVNGRRTSTDEREPDQEERNLSIRGAIDRLQHELVSSCREPELCSHCGVLLHLDAVQTILSTIVLVHVEARVLFLSGRFGRTNVSGLPSGPSWRSTTTKSRLDEKFLLFFGFHDLLRQHALEKSAREVRYRGQCRGTYKGSRIGVKQGFCCSNSEYSSNFMAFGYSVRSPVVFLELFENFGL